MLPDCQFEREKAVPCAIGADLLCHAANRLVVDGQLVVEVKSVERIHPVHVAQAVSYLRATGLRVGLLINFNVPVLKQGIRRVVL